LPLGPKGKKGGKGSTKKVEKGGNSSHLKDRPPKMALGLF
jgi:hypothetical protein